jgi:hypothetical protein
MTTWHFVGIIVGVVALLWLGRSLYSTAKTPDVGTDPGEDRRRADLTAAEAARQADARMPPFQGGYPV